MHDLILSSLIAEFTRDHRYTKLGIPLVNYPHEGLEHPYLYIWINHLDTHQGGGIPAEEQFVKANIACSLKSAIHGQSQGLSVLTYMQNVLCGRNFRVYEKDHVMGEMRLRLLDHQLDPKKPYCLEVKLEAILTQPPIQRGLPQEVELCIM